MILARLFDLSLRHKLPLWGSLLIISTAIAISASLLYRATADLKQSMFAYSEVLMHAISANLAKSVSDGNTADSTSLLNLQLQSRNDEQQFQVESLIVVNPSNQVIVSRGNGGIRSGMKLDQLGPEYAALGAVLDSANRELKYRTIESDGTHALIAMPLTLEGQFLGWLIAAHPRHLYERQVIKLVEQTSFITLLVLLLVLPISWYWGRRMANPLVLLARHMRPIGHALPSRISPGLYDYGDELGQLFKAYDQMCGELEEKEAMKHEMVRTERLAALGRLSAGVAHEINNPLGGLITAVDTLKQHAPGDPLVKRVLPLLERGLAQIKEIVGALLVETRARSHPLTIDDISDVQTLLSREVERHGVLWQWEISMDQEVQLPSTLIRQVLINLLLNAIQAAGQSGQVKVVISQTKKHFQLEVVNDGMIPPEIRRHLFEPFTGTKEGGHGLGLWVTYQIVQELRGKIKVTDTEEGKTRIVVLFPAGENVNGQITLQNLPD
jgi:two-component system NtrC family sensor kinase